ncbi:sialidase family protein [Prosthecobacter sp. SYSU 5D2]|uniref:sialidase family protein n=1 Tax=Prosthecobacter sp. SYSU 5D2 TaxID=3134134 RepID=UPI0031FEBB67
MSRFILAALLATSISAADFHLEHSTVQTSSGPLNWSQSRAALIPGDPARVIVTTQEIEKLGSHGFRNVYVTETVDGAKTWSPPKEIISLRRQRMPEGHDFVMGDICPQFHAKTGVVLAHGKTFGFEGGIKENRGFERVSYAVYSPKTDAWSGLNLLELPEKDHEGLTILEPNSGCHQRFDLPNGEILLPIRYRKNPKSRQYTTIVARCTFDGKTLTYKEHGSELTFKGRRGLYEPSVMGYQGRYFLTMRADESAFVSVSDDGLNYTPPAEWTFDDGQVLGSYNAQQHWVAHSDDLYLVYTRKGANNDHVFRHRAPLFIAKVDRKRLCILRATEQVLMPETGLDLAGGFGVLDYSPEETWIISTEMGFPEERKSESNRIILAKILWSKPNQLFK